MATRRPRTDGAAGHRGRRRARRRRKALTIGAVCKALEQEFPDISISKIRYLEDQKLLAPRRTPGGYRLYSTDDVSRLRTILRLQRDEFLPLRVIRQELAAGPQPRPRRRRPPAPAGRAPGRRAAPRRRLRRATAGALYSLEEVLEETGAEPRAGRRARGLRDRQGRGAPGGTRYYDETEREIVRAVRRARALRRRRAQPARVQDLGRPRVRAAAADPRPVAALAQPGAPQGGDRRAREPGRGRLAPQAPAAGARPAPDRAISASDASATCAPHIRDIPDFPKPGILFKDITPLLLDPRRWTRRSTALAELGAAARRRPRGGGRGARVHPRRRAGARARRRLRPGAQARQAAARHDLGRVHPRVRRRRAGDARRRARPRRARARARRPAGHRRHGARAVRPRRAAAAREVVGCAFLVELAFLGGRERLAGFDVHALVDYDAE